MLTHITVRDYTIVDRLELDLNPGMTAMTGETGAGKSILVDALGLAMGDRADIGIIRTGAKAAEISIGFDLSQANDALEWLKEHSMDSGDECIIRRLISREGRSKAFINNHPAPMQALKELGETLVDIHGQHQHQSLVKRAIQRQLLDDYAGNQTLVKQTYDCYQQWKKLSAKFRHLRDAAADSAARIELLRFQVDELEQLNLSADEVAGLNQEHDRLANAGKLLDITNLTINLLYESEENSAHQLLNRAQHELGSVLDLDPGLQNASKLINEASIQTQEAADELRQYLDRLDLDPQRLQWINDRLSSIYEISRKHHVRPVELPELLIKLSAELESLDNSDDHLKKMQDDLDKLQQQYFQSAKLLGTKRRKAALLLNKKVTSFVQELGMPNAKFEIEIGSADGKNMTAHGLETIDYMICTNPGQEFKLLSKIASGGELSRISLAIQVVLAETTRINTLVYDEVDTGIGGPTAEIVGKLLRAVGSTRQVMCVTHLPQVAAQAHNHLHVSKQADKTSTVTGITPLTDEDRIDEIARMLGGVKLTKQSRAHAVEMLDTAK